MAFVVESRLTGRFLRSFDGSYRDHIEKTWKDMGRGGDKESRRAVHAEAYSADLDGAKKYETLSGAISAIGVGDGRNKRIPVYLRILQIRRG